MTIEELLECSASKLESMTDSQLEEYFKPYLSICKPELTMIEKAKSTNKQPTARQRSNADDVEYLRRVELLKKLAADKGLTLNL